MDARDTFRLIMLTAVSALSVPVGAAEAEFDPTKPISEVQHNFSCPIIRSCQKVRNIVSIEICDDKFVRVAVQDR